ncbi:hypothetical protein FRB90_003076 [Tulasnella sp. 427]|nr:hypothetical protein FRB90_003076 [Tulasnella sp. 427]
MSLELVKELEERGLDDGTAQEEFDEERKRDWSLVEKQKTSKRKKVKSRSTLTPLTSFGSSAQQTPITFILSDIRQQANRQSSRSLGISTQTVINDPWTKVASLSARLAQLLPPLTASHFSSVLHNPGFSSSANAVRGELARIVGQAKDPPDGHFDVILAEFFELLQCRDGRDEQDATICLKATKFDVGRALDMVYLLRDLDAGEPIVVHSPTTPSSTQPRGNDLAKAMVTPLPLSPTLTPSQSTNFNSFSTAAWPPAKSPTDDWTKVSHERKRNANKTFEVDPLAAFIPAYSGRPAGWRSEGGRAAWEPDLNDETTEKECREMVAYYKRRREETLREATRYWKGNGGGTKNGVNIGRGGEVALYYAEEVRIEVQSVLRGNKSPNNSYSYPTSIDLHGTNTQEALTIARQAVEDWWSEYGRQDGNGPTKYFSIITGRGNHSRGGVGVIGPAVKTFLETEGWRFTQRPGTFVVTGSSRRRTRDHN